MRWNDAFVRLILLAAHLTQFPSQKVKIVGSTKNYIFFDLYIPNNIYPVIRDDVEIGMYYVGVGAK